MIGINFRWPTPLTKLKNSDPPPIFLRPPPFYFMTGPWYVFKVLMKRNFFYPLLYFESGEYKFDTETNKNKLFNILFII